MPSRPEIKPTHKPINEYYAALAAYAKQRIKHETALRSAFQNLLDHYGRKTGWTLIPELTDTTARARIPPALDVGPKADVTGSRTHSAGESLPPSASRTRPDGTFRDDFYIERGHWEAKDTADDLAAEIKKKIAKGYPLTNIIFEDTREARLYQNGKHEGAYDLTNPQALCDLLTAFFSHTEPAHDNFEKAVDEFKQRVPDLAKGLVDLIAESHKSNAPFKKAFDDFYELCKSSLNPNLRREAVDEMLVQHLLTERLIRTIFDNQDFTRRNVIAAEVEKVIDALVSKSFNRHDYLKQLDRFYLAIEAAAATIRSFSEKQHFLNVVYERFFQGYSVKLADTHGIVYTPQEIVDFMCASVEEVLQKEFGKTLGDKDVQILDPCTGTGNFIVNLINRIPKRDLPRVYKERLFANEVMLLPYYIAALNIEHAFYEKTGAYEPFEGLCFVDSLDLAEARDPGFSFMTEANTQRVERQKRTPITVIIGNPPYNMGQQNENDNNKNREYRVIDDRIRQTYAKTSDARLKNKLYDPYVKFFRWASDRLGNRPGLVCFVTNNGFLNGIAFDGFRKALQAEFHTIFHFDLRGDARTSGELRQREGGNIFQDLIRVGVGVTLLIRNTGRAKASISHHVVGDRWSAEKKSSYIRSFGTCSRVPWKPITPDSRGTWLVPKGAAVFASYVPIASQESKAQTGRATDGTIFERFSLGVVTSRDEWVYGPSAEAVADAVRKLIKNYNHELFRLQAEDSLPQNIENFVNTDPRFIKWTDRLKETLLSGKRLSFSPSAVRSALYRPYTKRKLYFDHLLNQRRYLQHYFFPTDRSENENAAITLTTLGSEKPFMTLYVRNISDLHLVGAGSGSQCFPFYTYDEDGTNRRENITDWVLKLFRDKYDDKRITKWDIFHYVYGSLHHKGYREKFADNLKRDLPRIPLAKTVDDFRAFRDAGKTLAKLHTDYESLKPWPLNWIETPGEPLSYRIQKMRLSKDKKSLIVNDSLVLDGIPKEVFDYRLGNRSALDWVIDQYQIYTDKKSGITSDPNREDDPEYIVRLIGQVVRVSLETVKIVNSLPASYGGPP